MQKYTYNWEVKDILTQFLQAFDGAIVRRGTGSQVAVRYVYAPKQRVLHDLVNKAQHITLPAVAFWISSIRRDNNRVFNKLEGSYYNQQVFNNKSTHPLQPVPVDIDVNISIITRFQSDMDQIITNFVPYSDPYFIISWGRESEPNVEVRSPVIWNNSLKLTYPVEQTPTEPTRIVCDTSFVIKGWLFKNLSTAAGRIYKIDANFYAVSATPTTQNISVITDPSTTESFTVSAVPQITYASRWKTPVDYAGAVTVKGSNLGTTLAIYLSGSEDYMFTGPVTVDPFSATSLSAQYPPLDNVVQAQSFSIIDENTIELNYQPPFAGGNFDIIALNAAGYTFMTQTAYISGAPVQPEYVNGIEVVNVFDYIWDNAYIIWDAATFQWRVA